MNAANTAPAALPVSFEFFPPKTPEGIEKLRTVRQQLYALQPQFCSVTYGAGGSTQDGTFRHVQSILDEGVSSGARISPAWVPRAIGAREAGAAPGHGRAPTGGAAWRSAQRLRQGGEFQLCQRSGGLHPRRNRGPLPHRGGRLPRDAPAGRSPEADLQAYAAKVRPVPIRPSRSISSTPTPISALWTRRTSWAPTCPWCRASCPSSTPAADALCRQLRRRDCRAGSGCACRVWRRHRVDQGLWPGCGDLAVRATAPARCAQPALLHHESKCNHTGNLPAPRFVMGRGARRVLGLGPGPVCVVAGEGGWNCHLAVGTFVFSQRGDRCRCLTGCGAGAP
jgi:hypothetical protein